MKVFLIKLAAFYFSCLLCYTLQITFGFSPVLSVALIGFIGSFYWFSYKIEKSGIHAVIYAGSFASMASPKRLRRKTWNGGLCLDYAHDNYP